MAAITPSTATILINATQALTASGLTSPYWRKKSGAGSLSGVSGSNATYNAPASPTVAVIQAFEEFWNITYNGGSHGSIDSNGNLVIANGGLVYANGAVKFSSAGCGFKYVVTSEFLASTAGGGATHAIGLKEGVTGGLWAIKSTGEIMDGGTPPTIPLVAGDVLEFLLSGTNQVILKKNGSTVHTFVTTTTWAIGSYPAGYPFPSIYNTGSVGTITFPPTDLVGSGFSGWNFAESTITVNLPPTLILGTGNFALTGQNIALLAARKLTLGTGNFALTGQNITLDYGQLEISSEYSPNIGLEAPVQITFTDTSDNAPSVSYWDFGDGITSVLLEPKHTYLAPGIYTIIRTGIVGELTLSETYTITIGGNPPTPPAGALEFDEIELDRFYSEGATGGAEYSTSILGNPQGVQQRNINRGVGIHQFELNFEGEDPYGQRFEDFLDFFHTRVGAAIGFRFFPFYDNRWDNEEIAKTNTSTAIYKLIRTYSKAGRTMIRRIVKPVPDLIVTINDNPATNYSAYTVDYTTGKITFSTPASLPSNGSLRVTGNYCIPVVFLDDKLTVAGYTSFADLTGLRVIEVLPKALGITD